MIRKVWLICFLFIVVNAIAQNNDRQLWLGYMDKVARPVLSNLAADKLKANMPVELSGKIDNPAGRKAVSYLEAFGRRSAKCP